MNLPEISESYWLKTAKAEKYPTLMENRDVDIVIVGGGITGITSAYCLAQEGFRIALLEANTLYNGTTGNTTAKLTAQHGLIYDELIRDFGEEKAKLYYEANQKAINWVASIVSELKIDCDFTEEKAYVYAEDEKSLTKLEKEMKAYETLGINGTLVQETPLPFQVKLALIMEKQYQFHQLKYLSKLVEEAKNMGVEFYENTTAVDVSLDGRPQVYTKDGYVLSCDFILSCSHFPFYDKGFYFARMYPERSYVVAATVNDSIPEGMYINAEEPTRSIRSTPYNGEKLLLISGDHHKTGQGVPTDQHYENLKNFAENTFKVKSFPYRWSAQDFSSLDKVPYIGYMTKKDERLLVATGFRKWGMSHGTFSALLFKDLILGNDTPYKELFTPSRFESFQTVKRFLQTNLDVAKNLVKGKLERGTTTLLDLKQDEGAIVDIWGERKGAYRDKEGRLYVVDTTCTHLGCEVEWNNAERTWDCPCHGSRFHYNGDVVEGPAEKPLKKVSEKDWK